VTVISVRRGREYPLPDARPHTITATKRIKHHHAA